MSKLLLLATLIAIAGCSSRSIQERGVIQILRTKQHTVYRRSGVVDISASILALSESTEHLLWNFTDLKESISTRLA